MDAGRRGRWGAGRVGGAVCAGIRLGVGAFVPLFVLAGGLALAYGRRGTRLVPIYIHAMFNAVSMVLILPS